MMLLISFIYTISFILLPLSYIFDVQELKIMSIVIIIGTGYVNFIMQMYKQYMLMELVRKVKEAEERLENKNE